MIIIDYSAEEDDMFDCLRDPGITEDDVRDFSAEIPCICDDHDKPCFGCFSRMMLMVGG